ncbi:MAG: superoxide dismutase [Dinghuibacter sp.]|nr:superoxide dismutase [Dinghuibacter sp.]
MNKREFLKNTGLLAVAALFAGNKNTQAAEPETPFFTPHNQQPFAGEFVLAALPYANDALEPAIDAQTMQIHHDRHHKAYVDNLNKAITANPAWAGLSLEQILHKLKPKDEALLRNNAGGHWNHQFFWNHLSPKKGQKPGAKTTEAINAAFGSYENFKTEFTKAAMGRFGSGWAWLCADKKNQLFIASTPNQDNPLMTRIADKKGIPILGIDVWEHAYYLKYQNKRADYVNAFYDIVNWELTETELTGLLAR